MSKKITHDITCNSCGKKAEVNLCNSWQKYSILPNGDYSEKEDEWEGDEPSIDLCQKCYDNGNY